MAVAPFLQQRVAGFAGVPVAAGLPRGQPVWAARPRTAVPFGAYNPRLANQAAFAHALPQPTASAGKFRAQPTRAAAGGSPPAPLDAVAVAEIQAYLTERGGTVPLGKLATDRPGLKKAQLEPHFFVAMPPDQKSDYIVSLDASTMCASAQPMGQAALVANAATMPGTFSTFGAVNMPTAAPAPRKRPREPVASLEPLPEEKVQSIQDFVAASGGAVLLDTLSNAFEGVKKLQLCMAGFSVAGGEGGRSDHVVVLPAGGLEPAGAALTASLTEPKRKKKKKEQDPNAPPPSPLSQESLQAIAAFLEGCGGTLSLGKLTTQFEGVKKVQLEPHFHLAQAANGDFVISLSADLALPTLQQQPLDLEGGLAGELGDLGVPSSLIGVAPVEQPAPGGKKKKQKQKRDRDPDAPPPPALEQAKIDEITAYLQQRGGVARLGRLSTDFPGLKKAQVEPHFLVCGDPAVDMSVCLDVTAAITNGLQMC
mmetsp:Transcript_56386/g.164841  ORF Transcript_56386/g.164841 Transcript_56386/m.164841 type:complete len:481 (+) Transcript_56386:58-1500(+)